MFNEDFARLAKLSQFIRSLIFIFVSTNRSRGMFFLKVCCSKSQTSSSTMELPWILVADWLKPKGTQYRPRGWLVDIFYGSQWTIGQRCVGVVTNHMIGTAGVPKQEHYSLRPCVKLSAEVPFPIKWKSLYQMHNL